MQMAHSLRVYANPLKLLAYLAGAAGFVVFGYVILRDAKAHADTFKVVMAYVCIGFFGLGALVIAAMNFRYVVIRHPLLEIDGEGWRYTPRLIFGTQTVSWHDIAAVRMYRRKGSHATSLYYLIVSARDPEWMPRPRKRSLVGRAFPPVRDMAILVQLNPVFLWMTPGKCVRLLDRIRVQRAYELRFYGVEVDDKVREM